MPCAATMNIVILCYLPICYTGLHWPLPTQCSTFFVVTRRYRMQNVNQSDVAKLKAELELRNAAAQYAMHGLSQGSTKHKFITKNMERMGELHDELIERIGEGKAARFLVKTMEK